MKIKMIARAIALTVSAIMAMSQLAPRALGIGFHSSKRGEAHESKKGEAHEHRKTEAKEHKQSETHENKKGESPEHRRTEAQKHLESKAREHKRKVHESKKAEAHEQAGAKKHRLDKSHDVKRAKPHIQPTITGFGETVGSHAVRRRHLPAEAKHAVTTPKDAKEKDKKITHGSVPGFPSAAAPLAGHGVSTAPKSAASSDLDGRQPLVDDHGPAHPPESPRPTADAGGKSPGEASPAHESGSESPTKHIPLGPGPAKLPVHAQHHPSWSDHLSPEAKKNADNVSSRIKSTAQLTGANSSLVSNWINSHPERVNKWQERGDRVRSNWRRHDHLLANDQSRASKHWWQKAHLGPWYYHHIWHHHRWQYWWATPSWAALCTKFPAWAHAQPMFYDYGPGGNVIYQREHMYVNGQDVGTAADYARSAALLATVDPQMAQSTSSADQWTALGTFAMDTSETDTSSTRLLQLAVDQNGIISGTMHNTSTKQSHLVQGRVDQQSQRVAFTIGDKSNVVLETGIYNLTQPQAPILVHFGTDHTEHYFLVRLDPPDEPKNEKESHESKSLKNTGSNTTSASLAK